jgi:hypothetical protein
MTKACLKSCMFVFSVNREIKFAFKALGSMSVNFTTDNLFVKFMSVTVLKNDVTIAKSKLNVRR